MSDVFSIEGRRSDQITSDASGDVSAGTVQAQIAELASEKQAISQKNQANGYAGLGSDGKIASNQMPSIALGDYLGTVASEAAMLLLAADPGDTCTRTDFDPDQVWLCLDSPATLLSSWAAVSGYVVSVNGETGAVTLTASDVGAQPADATLTDLANGQLNESLAITLPAAGEITIDASTTTHTAHAALGITHKVGSSGLCTIDIEQTQQGYTAHSFHAHLTSGAMAAGTDSGAMLVTVDTSSSTGGHIDGLHIQRATGNGADVAGIHVGSAVDPVHQVSGAEVAATVLTYNGAYTDISAAAASGASDVQLWVANGDIVYVGHASEFDEVKINWQVVASNAGIKPLFEYWNGAAWTEFKPIDGTKGGKKNGVISLTSADLTGWASVAVDGITKRWIRITRTAATLATPPTEDTITVVVGALYSWDSSGDIVANSITVGNLTANGTISGISAADVGADPAGSASAAQAAAIAASATAAQGAKADAMEGAPVITTTATSAFSAETNLGALTTGAVKATVSGGIATMSTVAMVSTSAGAGDSGKLPILNGSGVIDSSMIGASTVTTSSPLSGDGSGGNPVTLPTSATPTIVSLTLSQTTGTKPLTISSTTLNDNLNADMVDGYHASKTAGANIIPVEESGGGLKAEHIATGTATAGYVTISSGVGAVPTWGPQTVATSDGTTGGTGQVVSRIDLSGMVQNEIRYLAGPGVSNLNQFSGLVVNLEWFDTAATGLTHTLTYSLANEAKFTQENASIGTDFIDSAAYLHASDAYTRVYISANGTLGDAVTCARGTTITTGTSGRIGTTNKKFGSGAADCDGNISNVRIQCNTAAYFSGTQLSGNSWEVECWVRYTAASNNLVFCWVDSDYTSDFNPLVLYINSSNQLKMLASSNGSSWNLENDVTIDTGLSTNTWYHILASYDAVDDKLYIFRDGNLVRTTTGVTTLQSGRTYLSFAHWDSGNPTKFALTGQEDDMILRVYPATEHPPHTATFTAPSAEYAFSFPSATPYYVMNTSTYGLGLGAVGDITNCVTTVNTPANTAIYTLVSNDGGTTWLNHSGATVLLANIVASGSTPAQIDTYVKDTLSLNGTALWFVDALYSSDGLATPSISSRVVTYNEDAPRVSLQGNADTTRFTVRVFCKSNGTTAQIKKINAGTLTTGYAAMVRI